MDSDLYERNWIKYFFIFSPKLMGFIVQGCHKNTFLASNKPLLFLFLRNSPLKLGEFLFYCPTIWRWGKKILRRISACTKEVKNQRTTVQMSISTKEQSAHEKISSLTHRNEGEIRFLVIMNE